MHLSREAGYILVAVGVLFLILLFIYASEWYEITNKSCELACGELHELYCTHRNTLPLHIYAGITLSIILLGIGAYFALTGKSGKSGRTYLVDNEELTKDEQAVVKIIKDHGGIAFQSDIVDKTGFSKSKVSRILDKLEARGLLERRRRGMTNVVILK